MARPDRKPSAFLAMPFNMQHSDSLRNFLNYIFSEWEMELHIGNTAKNPSETLKADILEQIRQADVVVVDFSGANPNVAYEFGFARLLNKEILILHNEENPIGLIRFAPYPTIKFGKQIYEGGLAAGRQKKDLREELKPHLDTIRDNLYPIPISTVKSRTEHILSDLTKLLNLPAALIRCQTVYSSGFLSSFALADNEGFEKSEVECRDLLLQEKDILIKIAERGCRIICIISPFSAVYSYKKGGIALPRLQTLLDFVTSNEPAINSIDWVLSPSWQKNVQIIGNIAYYERFQKGSDRGDALTLRQASQNALSANIAIYELLYKQLVHQTFKGTPPSDVQECRRLLRNAAVETLTTAINEVNSSKVAK